MASCEPFDIRVSDDDIDDLKQQLKLSYKRLFETNKSKEFDEGYRGRWSYGTDKNVLKELVEYWMTDYEWKHHEMKLNIFSHYLMPVTVPSYPQTIKIHFIHEQSLNANGEIDKDAIPILFIHGWPGSFYEYVDCIPLMVNNELKFGVKDQNSNKRERNYHVVIASLPGFAFSEAASGPDMSPLCMSEFLHQLMINLGYKHFAIQGGDWGSLVCRGMAASHPESVAAMHLNLSLTSPPRKIQSISDLLLLLTALVDVSPLGKLTLSKSDKTGLERVHKYETQENGYFVEQATRPNTLGWAIEDSPVGLLSWILEKFYYWTDHRGNIYNVFTKDQILTAISIYWFSRSITSSCRIYYEYVQPNKKGEMSRTHYFGYIPVPTAMANFPGELFWLPAHWHKYAYNVKQYSTFDKGGHFAAWEQPKVFVQDVKKFLTLTTTWEDNVTMAKKREESKRNSQKGVGGVLSISKSTFVGSLLLSIALSAGVAFLFEGKNLSIKFNR